MAEGWDTVGQKSATSTLVMTDNWSATLKPVLQFHTLKS